MNNSKYNFGKVCNLIFKNTNKKKIKENVKKAREGWNKISGQKKNNFSYSGISFKIDNNILNDNDNLDAWINGCYFHPDNKKRFEEVQSSPILKNISYTKFIDQLQRMTKIIIWFNKKVILEFLNIYKLD